MHPVNLTPINAKNKLANNRIKMSIISQKLKNQCNFFVELSSFSLARGR